MTPKEAEETQPRKRKAASTADVGAEQAATPARGRFTRTAPTTQATEETAEASTAGAESTTKPRRAKKGAKRAAVVRKPVTAASLEREATRLQYAAQKAVERMRKQQAKEAVGEASHAVKELEIYKATLEKEIAKTDALLEKATAKLAKVEAKYAVAEE